jgi:ferredoxin-NADP reductase
MANPKRILATVKEITEHNSGVFSVFLTTEQGLVRFRPGQFLHLALDSFNPAAGYWPESRVFSIASLPGVEGVRIVYSVKGSFTARMRDELVVGRTVWLKYPYGEFLADMDLKAGCLVFVAGGTGVTPFVPLVCTRKWNPASAWMYYGVRNEDLLIFKKELQSAVQNNGLNLEVSYEEPALSEPTGVGMGTRTGKLDINAILRRHGIDENVHYYLSGPPAMVNFFKAHLASNSVGPKNIHIDAWE